MRKPRHKVYTQPKRHESQFPVLKRRWSRTLCADYTLHFRFYIIQYYSLSATSKMSSNPMRDTSASTILSRAPICAFQCKKVTEETEGTPGSPSEDAPAVLKRSFYTKYRSPAAPNFATLECQSKMSNFRVIGRGTCGTVFEKPGTGLTYKKDGPAASILQDYHLTNKVHEAVRGVEGVLRSAFPELTIPKTPRCHSYHPVEDQKFWSDHRHRFPKADDTIQSLFSRPYSPCTKTDKTCPD